ncbi:Mur ligase [Kordiimonas sediminis]|uniref:Mur ligase n=1 Tax=Kordiimonas sediminis TaxID=1735581 RepID=A0A919E5G2_9PROT|nr:UDP-N-acetylmuramoyl-tripeptide--D-alanyl-D-alanine ligase [Kordiimonas sediminis]GHF15814.1 Mur ligase [Kordiimonas sediminis]
MQFNLPIDPVILAITTPLLVWFLLERALTYMMFFQQEEYDGKRFLMWLRDKRAFDTRASLWFILAALVATLTQIEGMSPYAVGSLPLLLLGIGHGIYMSRKGRSHSKKPLVVTTRVKRILTVFVALGFGLIALGLTVTSLAPIGTNYGVSIDVNSIDFIATDYDWRLSLIALWLLVMTQAVPYVLVLSNKILEPAEERVKAKFRQEAVDKLASLNPYIIGITGSFGKTSTKHILSHILDAAAPTLATPGSVNTDMGITRVIREQLKPDHKYFIVEMGAYGPGSITRLCRLAPPDLGVITAVGAAHYERFKTLETVARAKFEMAEHAFARNGKTVISKDAIPADLLNTQCHDRPGPYISVGASGDVAIRDITMDKDGIHITIETDGETETLVAPLYGTHQAGNIAIAAATAREIGLPWSAIKGALRSVPQIRYRLEVTKTPGQPTIINDAYNSNPVGFKAALEVLSVLKEEGGRRILVTPGMVELGDRHSSDHYDVGKFAARHADIAVVVTPDRIPSFIEGIKDGDAEKAEQPVMVLTFDKQEDAEAWVRENARKGDAILFENNLPDLYEATLKL